MSLIDDLKVQVGTIFKSQWTERVGRTIPEPEDLRLGNDTTEIDPATILYADLRGSTDLVNQHPWWFAAEIYKTFLHCAANIVRSEGGAIRSYDGDRIMGIFTGDMSTTAAVRSGMKIDSAVRQVINPLLAEHQPNRPYKVRHVVGIDRSKIRAVRIGVRGGNDIVWIGRAANFAAKLTDLNLEPNTWITEAVYKVMADTVKFGGNPEKNMWKNYKWTQQSDHSIYGTTWYWKTI